MVTKETKLSDPKATPTPAPAGNVGLSPEQLLWLVQEMRRPPDPTPEKLAELESDKAMRAETAKLQLAKVKQVQDTQAACVHRRKDRSTHCVYEYSGQYLICQGCQAIIKPEPRPTGPEAKETSHHIYNTRMFNEHFTESQAGATTF
jgi:hypothetical protein